MNETRLRELLQPFGLDLSPNQSTQTLAYLDLLARWNAKINLTAIRSPEEAVTRHFGESLFIAPHMQLRGRLLDIGSGAGFPGLALKIVFPDLGVTLLEPVGKKRAFLKEAARVCGFSQVEVRAERLEEWTDAHPDPTFEFATMRAVGNLPTLVPIAAQSLTADGTLLLWLTEDQAAALPANIRNLAWGEPLPIPLSRTAQVSRARKVG